MFLDGNINIGNVTQRQTHEHRDFVEFCSVLVGMCIDDSKSSFHHIMDMNELC